MSKQWAYVSCAGGVVQDVRAAANGTVLVIDWDEIGTKYGVASGSDEAVDYVERVLTDPAFQALPTEVRSEIVADGAFQAALARINDAEEER
jgi:DNA polymerase II small subunit/DNA polymerase delta subunit B